MESGPTVCKTRAKCLHSIGRRRGGEKKKKKKKRKGPTEKRERVKGRTPRSSLPHHRPRGEPKGKKKKKRGERVVQRNFF